LPALAEASDLIKKLHLSVNESAPFHLLTPGIRSAYGAAINVRKKNTNVGLVAEKLPTEIDDAFSVGGTLFETDARSFLADENLAAEIFGPATLLVRHSNREEVLEAARNLNGHLTATIHGTEQDLQEFSDLIAILERKVGRMVFNGFPTGVEVSHAMVHGGPYPATSDGRSTSVGSQAIFRFCRPVCYQAFPQAALPDALKDANPLHIWRMIDGEMTREPIPSAVTSIG
jgi:NADP-dependent aldehyde dehydrogenase